METIKYIISSIIYFFDVLVGRDVEFDKTKDIIGNIVIVVIILIFFSCLFLIDRFFNYNHVINIVLAIVSTLLIVLCMFLIIYIVELY